MIKRTKITLVAGVTALALAGIGGGVAFAANDSGSATPPASQSATGSAAPAKPHAHRGLLARTEHGELTLRTKTGTETVDVQRGETTAVSATSITVRSKDGFTATYTLTSTTKVRKAKAAASASDVRTGDRIEVFATKSGGTDTVTRIGDAGPAPTK